MVFIVFGVLVVGYDFTWAEETGTLRDAPSYPTR